MFYSAMMIISLFANLTTDNATYCVAAAIWGLGAVFANGFKIRG